MHQVAAATEVVEICHHASSADAADGQTDSEESSGKQIVWPLRLMIPGVLLALVMTC